MLLCEKPREFDSELIHNKLTALIRVGPVTVFCKETN